MSRVYCTSNVTWRGGTRVRETGLAAKNETMVPCSAIGIFNKPLAPVVGIVWSLLSIWGGIPLPPPEEAKSYFLINHASEAMVPQPPELRHCSTVTRSPRATSGARSKRMMTVPSFVASAGMSKVKKSLI